MSPACTLPGDRCGCRLGDQPQSAHSTQCHGCAMLLSGTITSRGALAWLCPEPSTNTQDHLHSPAGSCTRCINRITPIHSLSQINPLPAPQAGRTRAPAPQGATFSLSQSSLGTESPPLAPAEDAWSFRPWATVPGPVTGPAGAPSAPSAPHRVSISSSTAANPHTSKEEASSSRALLPAPAEPCFQLPFLPAAVTRSHGRCWSWSCPRDVGHH